MAGGTLSLLGLSKSFGSATVLEAVDLNVAAGERHGLIGVNGAGKTTLFNLIAGDLAADAGDIRLDGRSLSRLGVQARVRAGVGRTYQVSSLAGSLTVRANLALSLFGTALPSLTRPWRDTVTDARTGELARTFGLSEVLDLPVADLSHGLHRQIELAMTLHRQPRLLLLDEPGAGLSQTERSMLATLIRGLSREVTLLMIEHDMDLILPLCERITVLHQGKVMKSATPAEVARDPIVRDIYLGRARAVGDANGAGHD